LSEIRTAIQAVRTAGQVLREGFSKQHQISFKGIINIVTEMDLESERLVCEILRQDFPNYGILGEEGSQVHGSEEALWIIDPLDGTTNYSLGYPLFGVSVALEKRGELTLGVVYNPLLDELFVAEKGGGATLNGQSIQVTQTTELGKSLLASGFPYDAWSNLKNNSHEWNRFIKKAISLRCDGSATLDLCHVAMGRLDGYWEQDLEAWDMAAGALIVAEAGGMVSLCSGIPFSPYQRNVLASNGHLHAAMLGIINHG